MRRFISDCHTGTRIVLLLWGHGDDSAKECDEWSEDMQSDQLTYGCLGHTDVFVYKYRPLPSKGVRRNLDCYDSMRHHEYQ